MKGTLPYLNLAGVVILALFCAVQWNINRKLNLGLNAAEKVRLEQGKKLAEQEKAAQGASADLDAFRAQVQKLSIALKEAEQKAAVSERQLSQLQSSQEQTKANLAKWTEAVAARDEQLKNARARYDFWKQATTRVAVACPCVEARSRSCVDAR